MFVKNGIAVGTKAITQTQIDLIKYRYPKHQIVISFDNDNAGISAMKKVVSSKHDFKFFNWFNSNTKEKDINDYILSKNNVNIFTNESLVEKLIVSKLTMKMQLVKNLNI
jgi:DNA primase